MYIFPVLTVFIFVMANSFSGNLLNLLLSAGMAQGHIGNTNNRKRRRTLSPQARFWPFGIRGQGCYLGKEANVLDRIVIYTKYGNY